MKMNSENCSPRYINSLELLLTSKYGEITDVRIVKNEKGKSKGFAYVEFAEEVFICMGWNHVSIAIRKGISCP